MRRFLKRRFADAFWRIYATNLAPSVRRRGGHTVAEKAVCERGFRTIHIARGLRESVLSALLITGTDVSVERISSSA